MSIIVIVMMMVVTMPELGNNSGGAITNGDRIREDVPQAKIVFRRRIRCI
jgi:hypothetical protein